MKAYPGLWVFPGPHNDAAVHTCMGPEPGRLPFHVLYLLELTSRGSHSSQAQRQCVHRDFVTSDEAYMVEGNFWIR